MGPGRFIALAEKNGLIVALGRWILRDACRQTRRWLDAGIAPPVVAVNLSAIQFKLPLELEKDIAATVAEFDLPLRILELELTESVLMDASRDHNEVLLRLREKGHRIAIDDFGCGYSSLDYLRRYPVDRIKIAQTFIADIGIEAGNDAIVRAALGLARELGIEVVVEGVETAAQLALLANWGAGSSRVTISPGPCPCPTLPRSCAQAKSHRRMPGRSNTSLAEPDPSQASSTAEPARLPSHAVIWPAPRDQVRAADHEARGHGTSVPT